MKKIVFATGNSSKGKRFYQRNLTRKENQSLNQAAKNAGVKNFDKFHNPGYKGLYNGETADDIAKRKGLRYREDILDNMGSTELIANLFRISQTEEKEMGNCLFMYGHFCLCLCNYFNNRYSVSRN